MYEIWNVFNGQILVHVLKCTCTKILVYTFKLLILLIKINASFTAACQANAVEHVYRIAVVFLMLTHCDET